MRWWQRVWIGGVLALAVGTGLQILPDAWPFVAWTMFADVGPTTSDQIVVVAEAAGGPAVHRGERLPGGFAREPYQGRFASLAPEGRRADCRRMLADLRAEGPVRAARVERWTWPLTDREPGVAPPVDRVPLVRCR